MLRFGLLICVCLFFLGCALLFAFGSAGSPCFIGLPPKKTQNNFFQTFLIRCCERNVCCLLYSFEKDQITSDAQCRLQFIWACGPHRIAPKVVS